MQLLCRMSGDFHPEIPSRWLTGNFMPSSTGVIPECYATLQDLSPDALFAQGEASEGRWSLL